MHTFLEIQDHRWTTTLSVVDARCSELSNCPREVYVLHSPLNPATQLFTSLRVEQQSWARQYAPKTTSELQRACKGTIEPSTDGNPVSAMPTKSVQLVLAQKWNNLVHVVQS